ncbi:hypothetical protein NQ318_004403 [Aromia moschata]|uniref:WH1 domain-containing protein n=1 Tax=Aromia moschata TaxID=1265417 RepID=A0AAV8YRT5_9CUCU|nr:hypothetical protein NQ318_004403 [Aromia moschata]
MVFFFLQIVLSCTIKKDFEYNKVMPTFHHWKTGDKKFGLTFQAAADARAFDKGVRTAVEDLLDGKRSSTTIRPSNPNDDEVVKNPEILCFSTNTEALYCAQRASFAYRVAIVGRSLESKLAKTFVQCIVGHLYSELQEPQKLQFIKSISFANTSPISPLPKCPKDVGDDDVFMTLDLPQDPKDSRSSSDSSTKGTEHLHRITYIGRDKPLEPRQPTYDPNKGGKGGENYPYVQLTAVHEYIYPAEDQHKPSLLLHRESASGPPKKCVSPAGIELNPASTPQQPAPPFKKPKQKAAQTRCRHCNELYAEAENRRGACEYAPDAVGAAINAVTCIGCAQCVCYHCAADAEGEFAQHPCDCADDENCARRWCCLTFLSVFVPCLWLYPPLKVCHWCGVRCGACGGRHAM